MDKVPDHFIKKEVLGAVPVLVATGFAFGFLFNYETDPYAELGIFLSSIGIGLAVGILCCSDFFDLLESSE